MVFVSAALSEHAKCSPCGAAWAKERNKTRIRKRMKIKIYCEKIIYNNQPQLFLFQNQHSACQD